MQTAATATATATASAAKLLLKRVPKTKLLTWELLSRVLFLYLMF